MHQNAVYAFGGTQRFLIEREIGEGGMGVVYQALDIERNTRVALKALTQRDALNIYRLKNEFRQLADLSHPNLVSLHELCNEGDWWFFTMELVDGQSFDDYVASGQIPSSPPGRSRAGSGSGPIIRDASVTLSQNAIGCEFPLPRITCNVKRLRHALGQLVQAVAALHNAGKLHRDIKPSNVLVTPAGRVVVLDFGLVSNSTFVGPEAQDADRTVGGCVFGTPAYMAPEQAAGEAVTPASDWYSVGAMLYEALTGQLPFDGPILEILRRKEETEPDPPSDLVKGVPDDLDQLCRDLLRRDPASRPSGPEILRYLTGHSDPPPVLDAQSTVASRHGELFIGRDQHLDVLRAAFHETERGRPVTVFVNGLSGMGKSALVRCFANELIRKDDAVVLRGRCYEREAVPYKAFDNIIDSLSRYMMRLPVEQSHGILPRNVHSLARLFPVLKRVKAIANGRRPLHQTNDPREVRNQAFSALKELLLRITDYQPLVIQIDDLQWADIDSARLLSHLLGPPDPPPILLVGAYRRDEAESSPFLQHVLSDPTFTAGCTDVRKLHVDRLEPAEARQLTSELLRDLPTANALFSHAIAKEAEGVPFFITELVQHLRQRSVRGEPPGALDTVSLDEVVRERVTSMPKEAQRLLEVLSVAAGPIEQGVALHAAGLTNGDRSALLSLRAARLIRTRGTRQSDPAETYHDRVRETVVAHMHPEAVRITHKKLAEALHSWDVGDPVRLVNHYTAAGDGVRAGETAVQAAHAAAEMLAFNRAAELYRKAIELLSRNDDQQRELFKALGDALANAGRGAQAAEAYLKAAQGAPAAEVQMLRRRAAQQYLRSGRIEEGLVLASSALAETGTTMPRSTARALATIVWDRLHLSMTDLSPKPNASPISTLKRQRLDALGAFYKEVLAVDPLRGTVLLTRFLREAVAAGDPLGILQGLAWEALSTALRHGESKAEHIGELLARADRLAQNLASPYATGTVHVAYAACNLSMGQLDGVAERAAMAEEIFRDQCPGTAWERSFASSWRYGAIELSGDLSVLAREAPVVARGARENDDQYTIGNLTLILPMAHMMADDVDSAKSHLERQERALSGDFGTFHLWVMSRMTDALLYQGAGREALEYLMEHWKPFSHSYLSQSRLLSINAHFLLGRAALAAGDSSRAARAAHWLRRFGRADATCYAGIIGAGLAASQDDDQAAAAQLRGASAACKTGGLRTFDLYVQHNLGTVLNGQERKLRDEADAALAQMGIRDRVRWTRTYSPGFDDRE